MKYEPASTLKLATVRPTAAPPYHELTAVAPMKRLKRAKGPLAFRGAINSLLRTGRVASTQTVIGVGDAEEPNGGGQALPYRILKSRGRRGYGSAENASIQGAL